MKNKFLFVLLTFGILSFCGCQQAPEAVQENMDKYNENKQIEEPDVDYCSIDDLKNVDIKKINEQYENIVLPEHADFSNVEDVCLLQVQVESDFFDKYEEEYRKLFGIKKEDYEIGQTPGGKSYSFDEGIKHLGIDECGFMAYIDNTFCISDSEVAESYHMGKDGTSNTIVEFKNGSKKLDDICNDAEEWYKNNFHNDSLDYKITDAFIMNAECENENITMASLCGAFSYKGISINNYFFNYYDDNSSQDDAYYGSMFNSVVTRYDDVDRMGWFSINNQTLNVIEDTPQDKIISFDNAVKKVSAKLSGFGNTEFAEVMPMYEITLHCVETESSYGPGQIFEARPVYAFLCKNEDSGVFQNKQTISSFDLYDKFCYVDMLTGEFRTNFQL